MSSATPTPRRSIVIRTLDAWGSLWLRTFELLGGLWFLATDVFGWLWRSIAQRRVRLGRVALVSQMVRVGVRSVPIVMLVSGSIGVILALQTEPPLTDFGQTDKIANIVGIAVFRELAPLISAVVLAGFAGAAIAAEIGTMVVGEEIEALEAIALDPVRFLVVPRVVATAVSLTLLTVLADLTAVIASGAVTVSFLGVPANVYLTNTLDQLQLSDFLTGVFKGGVFGLILSTIACYNGLRVSGGAAGVGRATTDTVVQSVVIVILADLLFTNVFYRLGWT